MIYGNDDSHWQIAIDQDKAIRHGCRFRINKSTEGNYFVDHVGIGFHIEALKKGTPSTLYHYFISRAEGSNQAVHIKEVNDPYDINLPICLDCEDMTLPATDANKRLSTSRLQAIVKELKGYKGFDWPMIYTRATWWDTYILPWSGWSKCPLMIADYGASKYKANDWEPGNEKPRLPRDWEDWTIRQVGLQAGYLWGASSEWIDLDIWNEAYPFPFSVPDIPPPDLEPDPIAEIRVMVKGTTYKLMKE